VNRHLKISAIAMTAIIVGIHGAVADTPTDQMILQGATKARACLKSPAGPTSTDASNKTDHMHLYADCLKSALIPVDYSSENEKIVDAGIFIAGRYILKREFGEIDQETYGARGKAQFNEIAAGYQWAVEFLKGRGVEKDAACAAIEWVDCKTLP
jgi:hypothetical protein